MRAIVVEKFGLPKNLKLKDVDKPVISASKVLVKIIKAGVNPVDTYIREGFFINLPSLPFIPGKDGAGIVEAVGENVTKIEVGQKVFICGMKSSQQGNGTYAEYTLASEEEVFPLADRLNYAEGAGIGIPYFTAYRALVLKAKCNPGETVLIHGASGAAGLACVQLAKKLNLKVIGTAGTEEGLALVKKIGADFVMNHKDSSKLEKIYEITNDCGVNVIVEMLANQNLDDDLNFLAPKGRVAVVGSRGTAKIDPRKMMGPETQIIGVALSGSTKEEWEETSNAIVKGVEEGWVKPVIDSQYPLHEAYKSHEDIMNSKGKKGKFVLSVQDP